MIHARLFQSSRVRYGIVRTIAVSHFRHAWYLSPQIH